MTNQVKITKDMLNAVTATMTQLIKEKGNMNKMVSVEEIESTLMQTATTFIPVTLCLRTLIDVKYVRYFKMESGKLVFGYTKTALQRMNGIQSINPEEIAL